MIKLAIGLLMLFIFSCSKSTAFPTDIGNQQSIPANAEMADWLQTNYNNHYNYLELADQGSGPTGQHYLIHKNFGEFSMTVLVHEDSIDIDTCKVYRKY